MENFYQITAKATDGKLVAEYGTSKDPLNKIKTSNARQEFSQNENQLYDEYKSAFNCCGSSKDIQPPLLNLPVCSSDTVKTLENLNPGTNYKLTTKVDGCDPNRPLPPANAKQPGRWMASWCRQNYPPKNNISQPCPTVCPREQWDRNGLNKDATINNCIW